MDALAYLLLTYLLGAVPFGLVISILHGAEADLRAEGSGNIGASNVTRLYGWRPGILVLLLDAAKGAAPVWLGGQLFPELGAPWVGAVAIVAFVGHCFPVYLSFHGGKGVATSAGAMSALAPWPTAVAFSTWVVLLGLTGRTSVASLLAAGTLVGATRYWDPQHLVIASLLCIGVVAMHSSNIRRLIAGREDRILRPVRFGRSEPMDVTSLLDQGPAGGPAPRDPFAATSSQERSG